MEKGCGLNTQKEVAKSDAVGLYGVCACCTVPPEYPDEKPTLQSLHSDPALFSPLIWEPNWSSRNKVPTWSINPNWQALEALFTCFLSYPIIQDFAVQLQL